MVVIFIGQRSRSGERVLIASFQEAGFHDCDLSPVAVAAVRRCRMSKQTDRADVARPTFYRSCERVASAH
jgi:hypothetical protein